MTAIEQSAKEAEARILDWFREAGLSWVRIGKEIVQFQDRRYYEHLGYHSFDAWLTAKKLGKGRSTIYRWTGLYRKLEQTNASKELESVTQSNAILMLKVPESKRNGELLLAAQNEPEETFKATIQKKFGNLHLEMKVRRGWSIDASLADVIDRVMELAKSENETESDAEALEVIFSEYERRHEV